MYLPYYVSRNWLIKIMCNNIKKCKMVDQNMGVLSTGKYYRNLLKLVSLLVVHADKLIFNNKNTSTCKSLKFKCRKVESCIPGK